MIRKHRISHLGTTALAGLLSLTFSPSWAQMQTAAMAPSVAPQSASSEPPLRDMWAGVVPLQHIRHWFILGPVTKAPENEGWLADGLSESGMTSAGWRENTSFGDQFELLGAAGAAPDRAPGLPAEFLYTATALQSTCTCEATLSVDTKAAYRVWLNGRAILPSKSDLPANILRVNLVSGLNRLLIRYEHAATGIDTSVTLAGAGQPASALLPGQAAISMDASGRYNLHVPVLAPRFAQAVRVSVIGPRGEIKSFTAPANATLDLQTTDLKDGPYQVRLVATSAVKGGKTLASNTFFYKGDVLKDAVRLTQAPTTKHWPDAKGTATSTYLSWLETRMKTAIELAARRPEQAREILGPIIFEYLAKTVGNPAETGFVRLAYDDKSDGSVQYCRVYLPTNYRTQKAWPAIINLHGFNPDNPDYTGWWSSTTTTSDLPDQYGAIFIQPHGRGNAQYTDLGENDVMRCLDQAKAQLNIDAERVYLTGESMGGSGTWLIGSRHPDQFAAIAPTYGGWDFRIASGYGFNLSGAKADWPTERFALETQSSFLGAESLLNVPVFVNHGGSDPVMAVAFSRHAVQMLQRWGYNVRYWEHPGGTHSDLDHFDVLIPWLLEHRRITDPSEVRLRSRDLAGANAYWVKVTAAEHPLHLIRVKAEVLEPGLIRLDTTNVAALDLSLPAQFVGANGTVRVIWNEKAQDVKRNASGAYGVGSPPIGQLHKKSGLEGRISDVLDTPFMLVVGTHGAPDIKAQITAKAQTFQALWSEWQHQAVRIKNDTDVTVDDLRSYSVILLGGPTENQISAQWKDYLPFKVSSVGFNIGHQSIPSKDAVLQMIYPSPTNPERYVLSVVPQSAAGMYFWNAGGLWQRPFGFPQQALDWTIQDGLRIDMPAGVGAERGLIASGVFDETWQATNDLTFMGDGSIRQKGVMRFAALAKIDLNNGDYVGTYELVPGFSIVIASDGAKLSLLIPGMAPATLVPEGNDEFGTAEGATALVFQRNAQGKVVKVSIFGSSPVMTASRKDL